MNIFISHAHTEKDLAHDLAQRLSEAGFGTAPDDLLFPGENWPLIIGRALEESEAMVVLVSPEAAQSEGVRSEVQYALGSLRFENRLFPVLVRPTEGMRSILARFPVIPGDGGAEAIGRRIIESLDRSPSEVAP